MSKGAFALVVLLVAVVAGAMYFASSPGVQAPAVSNPAPAQTGGQQEEGEHMMGNGEMMGNNTGMGGEMMGGTMMAKTFKVGGENFKFSPSEIRVKKGDQVRIEFSNVSGWPHDWVIDEYNVRTPQINVGESATVEFVADKAGTFEYYCSVGQHRAQGMKGNFIVE